MQTLPVCRVFCVGCLETFPLCQLQYVIAHSWKKVHLLEWVRGLDPQRNICNQIILQFHMFGM